MPVPQQFVEPDAVADQTERQPGKHAKPRRRWRRVALVSLLVVALLGGGGLIAGGLYLRSVESDIERVDAFADVPEQGRPQAVAKGAMNILILGSDTRDPESTSGSRTDTIILAHLPKDRSSAQLISIPRDTWVAVPRSKDGSQGGRDAKINAAYAWGGVPLMVQTVEKFTSVRIDHVMMVDFAGFKEIIDALGGIDIDAEKSFTSIHPPFRTFRQGVQRMDGETALDYSRQRKQFPDGDFARIRHQQQVIKAILDRAVSGGIVTNPGKLNSFVKATSNAVSVDEKMSLLSMATDLRGLRGDNLRFITSPTKGTGRVGSESVVFANTEKAKSFYDAVRRDAVAEIVNAGK
ncbi:transcriptional attenuator, LytR family [Micromonospora echinofusca]|uniref:Transcriptional attenuator, LytR family n=1 Tax=Micromonospora echinofusca TaxID=47858 RepID=A0A1C5GG57_MICEH|nr:LCP family protein [Micromonospora echinofusca]SCG18096.1 transcriptional attenuator, LytR family [Micromonospora echinofusca]